MFNNSQNHGKTRMPTTLFDEKNKTKDGRMRKEQKAKKKEELINLKAAKINISSKIIPTDGTERHLLTTEGSDIEQMAYKSFHRAETKKSLKSTMKATNNLSNKKKEDMGEISKYLFGNKTKILNGVNFRDTKELEFIHQKYLINSLFQCVFAFISIFSAIIEYEGSVIKSPNKDTVVLNIDISTEKLVEMGVSLQYLKNSSKAAIVASWFCLISSIGLWITIIYDYFLYCEVLHYSKKLSEEIWRKEWSNIFNLILNLIIFFLHPNPITYGINHEATNDKYGINYQIPINAYFCVVSLIRSVFFVKFLASCSDFYTPRTQRVCDMNSFDTSLYFAMKAMIKKKPFQIYPILFLGVLLLCAYANRIFERATDSISGLDYDNYWNSIWCLFITMTTVGYGDYTPSTWAGRIIVIIGCFFGVFLISTLVVAVNSLITLKGNEGNIYLCLERVDLMADKDQIAATLVSKYVKVMKSIKDKRLNHEELDLIIREKDLQYARNDFLYTMHGFKEKNKEIDATYPSYSNLDNVEDNLFFLEKTMGKFHKKYQNLNSLVDKIVEKLNIKID
jgi:hypothetical protein